MSKCKANDATTTQRENDLVESITNINFTMGHTQQALVSLSAFPPTPPTKSVLLLILINTSWPTWQWHHSEATPYPVSTLHQPQPTHDATHVNTPKTMGNSTIQSIINNNVCVKQTLLYYSLCYK